MKSLYRRYAELLVRYCLALKKGDRVFVRSTYLAEPLLVELYREILKAGAIYDSSISLNEEDRIQLEESHDGQMDIITPVQRAVYEHYDAFCTIRAPFNVKSLQSVSPERKRQSQEGRSELHDIFMRRSAEGTLRWVLCQFPADSSAQECGMSRSEYESFVCAACKLDADDPVAQWIALSAYQKAIAERLNRVQTMRFVSKGTDISFSVRGRLWINSDGKRNMPSGEIFTSPVEDSVDGVIRFSYPGIYMGEEIEGIELHVQEGYVTGWDAAKGKKLLDQIFEIDGARRFGEAAIGTNDTINRFTKNILFDEKIGGTIHMALGASYPETGGKNTSALHWDLINDMHQDSGIYADGILIYQNGSFIW
jgi:aminopeptidase